jgi:hypothetical protein
MLCWSVDPAEEIQPHILKLGHAVGPSIDPERQSNNVFSELILWDSPC